MVIFKQAKILMFRSMLGCALLLGSVGLSSCDRGNNNYRVTLTVEADGQTYTGSEVQKMTCHKAMDVPGSMDVNHCYVRGESVAVQVGDKGYLFLLLDGWDYLDGKTIGLQMSTYGKDIFQSVGDPYGSKDAFPDRWKVNNSDMPVLCVFTDMNNQSTAKNIKPDDIEDYFGRGSKLVSLQIEKTSDAVTTGNIVRLLPWISSVDGYLTGDGRRDRSIFSSMIEKSSFTTLPDRRDRP